MTSLRDEEIDRQEAAQDGPAARDGSDDEPTEGQVGSTRREKPEAELADAPGSAQGRVQGDTKDVRGVDAEVEEEFEEELDELAAPDDEPHEGLTPREARRVRAITAAVFMACIAVALIVQLGDEPTLVTIGFYGIGLILSGIAIKLSYAGRTRLAMAVLGTGLGLVVVVEQFLRLM